MNKKPISKIIQLGKVKEFALSDLQESDPAYNIDLGDTVEITVIGKVVRSADAGENLFAFSREFAVESQDAFVKSVKKWEAEKEPEGNETENDPMYTQAREIVVKDRKASASFLQRRMKIGYARAAHLIDCLEERGVVATAEGAKDREVLVTN